ncbi:thioredoxin family protein [Cellulomonas sp. P24]|uniref:thioredoxin family protein n=1 Tax=Cellulomonas sp. P24 TaxID=2885206 RepID=UPI00216B28F0|nr:thioredoxin family protein [Cellulomonas sp. P24]MCR6491299.1 thioredoxin family protein [Cellulomonas sp. P24]
MSTERLSTERLSASELGAPLGERLTFVQFSSAFCGPCRMTRQVLERVAATSDGVVHLELDVVRDQDLAETLEIVQTPTVLVLDGTGAVRHRLTGVPTVAAARALVTA